MKTIDMNKYFIGEGEWRFDYNGKNKGKLLKFLRSSPCYYEIVTGYREDFRTRHVKIYTDGEHERNNSSHYVGKGTVRISVKYDSNSHMTTYTLSFCKPDGNKIVLTRNVGDKEA